MEPLRTVFRRDNDDDAELNPVMVNLLIALLVLILVSVGLVGVLLIIRRKRRSLREKSELPMYNDQCSDSPNNRRLTITATPYNAKKDSVYILDEKRNLVQNSASPPTSPIPEIRITFPEEEDAAGKRKSGGVVLVRIGEGGGVGLEPVDEDLPPYQSKDSDRFQSLDLERMGGLKEKDEKDDLKRYS